MKKLLLFTLCVLISCQYKGQQTFNRAYQNVNELANPFLIKIHSNLYFTTYHSDSYQYGQSEIYRHNGSGNLVSRTPLNSGFYTSLGFKSFDDKLILVGNEIICDVVGPDWHISLTKLDTNGITVLFSTSVTTSSYYDYPKVALQRSDSGYSVFTDSLLYNFSKTGQFLSKINTGLHKISSALALSNNNILISCDQGSSHVLAEISAAGQVLTSHPSPASMRQFSFYNNQKIIGVGTDGVFYKFSAGMNLIASSSFTGGLLASNFVCYQDTIYSLSSKPMVGPSYFVADTSFNVFSLTSTTTHSIGQLALCLSGSEMAILSSGLASSNPGSTSSKHYFASLNVINKFGSNNFVSDISLRSVTVDSMYTICSVVSLPSYTVTNCQAFLRPKVLVKNVGTNVIQKFKLNCFNTPAIACGSFYYQEEFSDLSLQPGDSVTLVASTFSPKFYAYSSMATQSDFPVEYCFYTTLPNGETDKTVEDNEVCGTFNFLVTSLKQNSREEIAVKISPNPFTSNLNIKSDVILKDIKIMNSLGMLVKRIETGVADTDLIIDNSDLASGIYFINIETEKGSITKKIIKQ